jgi:hypothetical protein
MRQKNRPNPRPRRAIIPITHNLSYMGSGVGLKKSAMAGARHMANPTPIISNERGCHFTNPILHQENLNVNTFTVPKI